MPTSSPPEPPPRPRAGRELFAGLVAGTVGGVTGAGAYWIQHAGYWPGGTGRFAILVMGYVVVCGLAVGTGFALARRWSCGVSGTLALAGIMGMIPGLLGVLGFGSLHAPYMGTARILATCLLGGATYVLATARAPGLPGRAAAMVSAALVATAVGVLGWMFVNAIDIVPSFPTLRAATCAAPVLFASLAGAGLAIFLAALVLAARAVEDGLIAALGLRG